MKHPSIALVAIPLILISLFCAGCSKDAKSIAKVKAMVKTIIADDIQSKASKSGPGGSPSNLITEIKNITYDQINKEKEGSFTHYFITGKVTVIVSGYDGKKKIVAVEKVLNYKCQVQEDGFGDLSYSQLQLVLAK
jgi:hypothetical protein